ncbi:MAG: shikimate dehydrogenase [Rhodobacteraceae bacterium]|nr:shikimate dehydrogenase [Paracoccaceae bacterium]
MVEQTEPEKRSIPLTGLIGAPVAQSRSPKIHAHWLHAHGLEGYYIPLEVSHHDLADTLRMLPRLGFVGVNVTMPHKERVLDFVDQVSDQASLIGAANTLAFRRDGGVSADNTDAYGFIENLRQTAPQWQAKAGAVVVLGAGGAARAVVVALLDAGVEQILIVNRTRARAERLQKDFGARLSMLSWVQAAEALQDCALLVNTTSLGMVGHPPMPLSLDGLHPTAVVCDLVYSPLRTKLLQAAHNKGHATVDGLGMVLHQAAPAFEKWFGIRPTVDETIRKIAHK